MKKLLKFLILLLVLAVAAAVIFLNWPLIKPNKPQAENEQPVDVVVIGGGIMSMTLSTLLQELEPDWKIEAFERLDAGGFGKLKWLEQCRHRPRCVCRVELHTGEKRCD